MSSISTKPYVYIAAPFFNEVQNRIVENVKDQLESLELPFFSPKDECMFVPGVTTPEEILQQNMDALHRTDLLVCVTDGKDPGTFFEAGWCYANGIPIIYIWLSGTPEQKFNLVLAASGSVVRSYSELDRSLVEIKNTGAFIRKNWSEEEINYE